MFRTSQFLARLVPIRFGKFIRLTLVDQGDLTEEFAGPE